jgi:TfoX/Sxy family transcriptional regulator of competence genes
MSYYELPADLLEDADALRPWVEGAVMVAKAARRSR